MSLWANPADSAKVELDSIANVPVNTIRSDTLFNESDNCFKRDTILRDDKETPVTNSEMDSKIDNVVKKVKNIAVKIGIFILSAFILLLGLLVGLFYTLYKKVKKMDESYLSIEEKLTTVENKVTETAKKVEEIKLDIANESKQKVTFSEQKQKEANGTNRYPSEEENLPPKLEVDSKNNNQETVLYAKPRGKEGLLKVTHEQEAIYTINKESGAFRLYDKDSPKQKAIKNKEDMLSPFCNATGSSIDAKDVRTIHEGRVEVENAGDGVWRVIKKAEIKFIK